jgi:hypothetical protein
VNSPRMLVCFMGAIILTACATPQPRSQAELQQERAESRADSAREVADTHKAANAEVRKSQKDLRKAEDETMQRDAQAQESRVREAAARTRAADAQGVARERIRSAEAESDYRTQRNACDRMAGDARHDCISRADGQLKTTSTPTP